MWRPSVGVPLPPNEAGRPITTSERPTTTFVINGTAEYTVERMREQTLRGCLVPACRRAALAELIWGEALHEY